MHSPRRLLESITVCLTALGALSLSELSVSHQPPSPSLAGPAQCGTDPHLPRTPEACDHRDGVGPRRQPAPDRSQFNLAGAHREAVARDQRQRVAVYPRRRLILPSLR